jgi:hypothetical protein
MTITLGIPIQPPCPLSPRLGGERARVRGSSSTRRVPLNALYFAADVTVVDAASVPADPPASPPPPKSITIRARTAGEAYQGFWGRCVHDMAGYLPPTSPIPLNFNHDRDNLIGVIPTAPTIDAGELVAAAQIVPFTDADQAAEIIYKGKQGVPYQASVQLDLPTLIVEEVEANITVNVNGQDFTGPLVVFRQWGLAAISICPFGADSNTSVEFRRGDEFDVTCFSAQGSPSMDDTATSTTPPAEEKKPEPSAFAAWAKDNFAMDEADMNDEQKAKFMAAFEAAPKTEEQPPEENSEETPPEDAKKDDFAATAKRMLTDFGATGAVWAAEGKSYNEAAGLFRTEQATQLTAAKTRITELEAKLADFEKRGNFHRGHATPAAFQPPADQPVGASPGSNATDFSGFSPSRQSLINAIASRLKTSAN